MEGDAGVAVEDEESLGQERGLKRSRTFAVIAFILLATAALLPWWTIRLTEDGAETDRVDLQLWDRHLAARDNVQWVSVALLGGSLVLLFVRLAAGSWKHEPTDWQRDVAIALGLAFFAFASAFFWPADSPAFWDTTHATVGDIDIVEKARPGLGWWTGALGTALLAVGAFFARPMGIPR